MKTRIQKVMLLFWSFLLLSGAMIHGESKPDVRGFDSTSFDYSFSRADQALDPGNWIREAQQGLTLAQSTWERIALTLYQDETERTSAQAELNRWSQEELQRRFARWLEKRFFAEQGIGLASGTRQAIREANKTYLYKTDHVGNLLYDAETGDPLVIRPEDGGLNTLDEDQKSWQVRIEDREQADMEQYRTLIASYTPELLAYLSPEQRQTFAEQLTTIQDRLLERKQKELEVLISQEQRLFIARRTGDVWSLRKKSESEAAAAIVSQLIKETQNNCDQSLTSLQAKIEAASAGTGDLALMGSDWLEAYKEQFQRGLDAWQKAEERFMLRRIEWEQAAGKQYAEGEEAWSKAFASLEKEQQVWESKARSLFQAGEETFKRASDTLEQAIAEAKAEFQKDADLRSQAGADRARAWVDTYVTSGTMVVSARESSQYWIDKLKKKNSTPVPTMGDPALISWVDQTLKQVWTAARNGYEQRDDYKSDIQILNGKKGISEYTLANVTEWYNTALKKQKTIETEYNEAEKNYENLSGDPDLSEAEKKELLNKKNTLYYQLLAAQSETNRWKDWVNNYDTKHAQAVADYEAALANYNVKHRLYFEICSAITNIPQEAAAMDLARRTKEKLGDLFDPDLIQAGVETKRWIKNYEMYSEQAKQALNTLTGDFGLAIGSGAGALVDVLNSNMTSEDFHLDEYQIELLRAQAVESYWSKRVAIAQAVSQYAEDLTAGRTTDAESVAAWKAAKARYDEALNTYRSAQEALSQAGSNVQAARDRLNQAAQDLALTDQELEELNKAYALKMSILAVGSTDYLKEELSTVYKGLLETYGLLAKEGDEAPYVRYLEKAKQYGLAEQIERTGLLLKSLVQAETGGKSLEELQQYVDGILEDTTPLPEQIADYGIDDHSSWYHALGEALAAYNDPGSGEKDRYETLVCSIVEAARAEAKTALEDRLDSIGLLASTSWSGWYESRGGTLEHGETLTEERLRERLTADLVLAERTYLSERLNRELAVLEYFVHPDDSASEEIKGIVSLSTLSSNMDTETARTAITSLTKLQSTLMDLSGADRSRYRAELEALAGSDAMVASFLQGRGFCVTQSGLDLVSLSLRDSQAKLHRSQSRMQAYERYGKESPLGAAGAQDAFWAHFQGSISALGLSSLPYGVLPSPAELGAALLQAPGGTEAALGRLLADLETALSNSPSWFKEDISRWETALVSYVAAKGRYEGNAGSPASPETLQESIKQEMESIAALQNIQQTLYAGTEADDGRPLCLLLNLGKESYGGLSRAEIEAEVVHRIARSLIAHAGDLSDKDRSEWNTILTRDAAAGHAYANEDLRTRSVDEALEQLDINYALIHNTDPGSLNGAAQKRRLYDLFINMDIGGLENLVSTSIVSLDLDTLKPGDISADTIGDLIPALIGVLDSIRSEAGSGAVYEERAVALLLAEQLKKHEDIFSSIIKVLNLGDDEYATGLLSQVKQADFVLGREVFSGIDVNSPFYGTGVEYYLKKLLWQGDEARYDTERTALMKRLSDAGKGALVKDIEANLDRFAGMLAKSHSYAGMSISGDSYSYAMDQTSLSVQDRLALGRFIATGNLYDPFMEALGRGQKAASLDDVYTRWLSSWLQETIQNSYTGLAELQGRLQYAQAWQSQVSSEAKSSETGVNNWRIYLQDGNFKDTNDLTWEAAGTPEGAALQGRAALSWKEGTLADAYDSVALATRNLSSSLSTWKEQLDALAAETDFRQKIGEYLTNPGKAWDENSIAYIPSQIRADYSSEYNQYRYNLSRLTSDQMNLARTGAEIMKYEAGNTLKKDLADLSKKIQDKQSEYETKAGDYERAAEDFAGIGAAYDALYGQTKNLYDALETARQDYEKEDAIRRWASTAYLDTDDAAGTTYRGPAAELAYTQERQNRAKVALQALKNLYAADATERPYQDAAYNQLYREYQNSFDRMLLTYKVRDLIGEELAKEYQRNSDLYKTYMESLYSAGTINYNDYEVKTDIKDAGLKDVLTIDDQGHLRLNYTDGYRLTLIDEAEKEKLKDYFNTMKKESQDTQTSSAYERQIREWATRMATYHLDNINTFTNWTLARDYLMNELVKNNYVKDSSFDGLGNEVLTAESLENHIGSMNCRWQDVDVVMNNYRDGPLAQQRKAAYEHLSEKQKEDLEFLIIMQELGNGGSTNTKAAFSYASVTMEYENISRMFDNWIDDERSEGYAMLLLGTISFVWAPVYYTRAVVCFYNANQWQQVKDNSIDGQLRTYKTTRENGAADLVSKVNAQNRALAAYQTSNARIATMEGVKNTGSVLTWYDLEEAIKSANGDKKLTDDEINRYKEYWIASGLEQQGSTITNVSDALVKLATWSRNKRDDAKRALTTCYSDDAKEQQAAQQEYRKTLDAYIAGNASEAELKSAAEKAFGKAAASRKVHLSRLEGVYEDNLEGLTTSSSRYQAEYNQLGQELADLVGQTWKARLEAELAAREVEWNQQRQDLAEKRSSWREAAGLIMERGRADWKAGLEWMRDSYTNWKQGFSAAYEEGSLAWDTAYLAGLKEKEAWAERATATAMEASSEAMLALVGSDAEAGARTFDTLGMVPSIESGAESARAELDAVLNLAGITNLGKALEASVGSAETAAREVRTGLGGLGLWDSGKAQVAATSFSRKANQELASRQARLLAAQARDMAQAAIKGLEEQVKSANDNFREGMDDTFVLKGSWRKEGQNYSKDVVVYSTLMDPVVTERASVEGYKAYIMKPVNLTTDLSDQRLQGLEASAIQALIKNAQDEVKKESETIFGSEEDNSEEAKENRKKIIHFYKTRKVQIGERVVYSTNSDGETIETRVPIYKEETYEDESLRQEKTWGAGEFGAHIGFDPVLKENPNVDDGLENIWQDKGKGELGRLMRSYIYWSIRESQGWATVNKPMWDKPAWDDRSKDGLKAPTIRGLTDIGVTIAASVLLPGAGSLLANAALNLADDAVFAMLDVGGGYKSWEEAGLDFGKKALSSAVNIGVGQMFNPVMAAVSTTQGMGGVIGSTMVSGMQTFTTSTLTSAVNAFNLTYDKDGNITGLGWSADSFNAGVQGGLVSAATGMTNSLTSGILSEINLFDGNHISLTDKIFNTESIKSFNSLAGSLAGQGVNYALTGDFALNVMNLGMFGINDRNGNLVKNGLLELHLGRKGATMNIGMGGVDVSLGTIAASMSGLRDTLKIGGAKLASLVGSYEGISTLNAVNMLGYTGDDFNITLGSSIWKGGTKVKYTKDLKASEGNYGAYDHKEPDEVMLSNELLGNGKEQAAKLASVMAHEGTHVAGNRYEAVAYKQSLDTYQSLLTTFGLTGDRNFSLGMVAALLDPRSYEANTGDIDHWEARVHADGTQEFLDDQKMSLSFTYLDPQGNVIGGYTVTDPSMQDLKSRAGAIAKIFGLDRIETLLGSSLSNADTYDFQTLKDVLKLSDSDIQLIQHTGRLPDNITEAQRLSLAGEALLKSSGGKWNTAENKWEGMNLALSTKLLEGGLYSWINEEGGYDFATASMTILRDPMSNFVRNSAQGPNLTYAGRDSILVTQRDLDGNVIGQPMMFNGFTTVQTLLPDSGYGFNQFIDQSWTSIYGGSGTVKVGPETLAVGAVGFNLMQYPDNSKKGSWGISQGDPYLRASFGSIVAGTQLRTDGSTSLSSLSIAMHPTQNFGNTGCIVTGNYGGRTGVEWFTDFTSYLRNDLRLPYGYTMYGQIQQKYNPYIRVGR